MSGAVHADSSTVAAMRPRVLHALLMISAAACSGAPGAPATPAPPHTTDAPAVAELQPTPAPTPPPGGWGSSRG